MTAYNTRKSFSNKWERNKDTEQTNIIFHSQKQFKKLNFIITGPNLTYMFITTSLSKHTKKPVTKAHNWKTISTEWQSTPLFIKEISPYWEVAYKKRRLITVFHEWR